MDTSSDIALKVNGGSSAVGFMLLTGDFRRYAARLASEGRGME
jgi:hypothetical protein